MNRLAFAILAISALCALAADESRIAAAPGAVPAPGGFPASSDIVREAKGPVPVLASAKAAAVAYSNSPQSFGPFPRLLYQGEEPAQGCENEAGGAGDWFRGLDYNLLLNNDVIAYYGKPGAPIMGILGRFPKEAVADKLAALTAQYDAVNGERGARAAFYLIYGTVWPEGEIGILKESVTREWIEYALSRGMLVFLDHQIGKYSVEDAMKRLLPWLKYPNVHLALDPEWRTAKPMQEIGSVTAQELNAAQRMIQERLRADGLPGSRMLVVHQFKPQMIQDRASLRADYDRVVLVHCADGFGHPAVKQESYLRNAQASNAPVKGYKLFYNSGYAGAGFDDPLLSPAQVMALQPAPAVIMYQ
jgi:hypothetical protein